MERVLTMRSAGLTLQAIADTLNSEGIPTKRGGRWQPKTIKNLVARAGEWPRTGTGRKPLGELALKQVCVQLTPDLAAWLSKRGKDSGTTRSALVARVLQDHREGNDAVPGKHQ